MTDVMPFSIRKSKNKKGIGRNRITTRGKIYRCWVCSRPRGKNFNRNQLIRKTRLSGSTSKRPMQIT